MHILVTNRLRHYLLAILTSVLLTTAVRANLTFDLGTVMTGDAPSGSGPWLRASFTSDPSVPGTVDLLLTTLNLTGSENIKDWAFNFDSAVASSGMPLTVSLLGGGGSYKNPSFTVNTDKITGFTSFKLDFDFGFTTGGDLSKTFSQGDWAKYRIAMSGTSLVPNNFDASALAAGGSGASAWYSAAHIQNTTGPSGSGKIGATDPVVPEPSTWIAGALLLIPFGISALRRLGRA